ncbi:MAG: type II toxin-antitoxin system HicA family toxin [bacterium]
MTRLPVITGKDAIETFKKAGFYEASVVGSHHVLKKERHFYNLSIPVHGNKPLDRGLLRRLIRDSGLTVDEFTNLL